MRKELFPKECICQFRYWLSAWCAKGDAIVLVIVPANTNNQITAQIDADIGLKYYDYFNSDYFFRIDEKGNIIVDSNKKIKNTYAFFDNIARTAFNNIITIWEMTKNNRIFHSKYKNCTPEELKNLLKKKYRISEHFF